MKNPDVLMWVAKKEDPDLLHNILFTLASMKDASVMNYDFSFRLGLKLFPYQKNKLRKGHSIAPTFHKKRT